MVSGPVTIGIRRCVLLLPPGFLESVREADLDAVLAHESAHMRRRDFAKNLFYSLLSLPVAYHPLLWLTFSRIAETREMVCDEVAANTLTGTETYARALLRLASMLTQPMPTRTLHAIGIFDANIFERRIMKLSQKQTKISLARRIMIVAACAALAIATCTSALAFHVDVPNAPAPAANPKTIHVKADSAKLITHVNPVYPPKAKAARVQGSVILAATIGKDGVPEHLVVQKGPSELQASALDAVRQWRWQPYLLNGEPIEVETTVTVVYALARK
jgi:TonB family protein